ncbi:MAG: RIP metalloprotease RseP [Clostridia bacterium]|nr:RIP metalloprotease RseP [Clostridia bacterium]
MATVISAIVIFLVLVLVHEFGHFITAKLCGVTVNEFAIGMGPTIFKKEYKGTKYSLRCIPIGGFCAMEGEDEESDSTGAFSNKKPWQRILILVSGAAMNLILGFVLMCIVMFSKNAQYVAVPVVNTVLEDSAAEQAGLQPGDEIVKIDNADIQTQMELKFELTRYKGGSIDVEYIRDGKRHTTALTPKQGEDGVYYIGFEAKAEPLNFGGRVYHAFQYTLFYGKAILVSLFDLVTGNIGAENMSGPVGIVSEIGNAAQQGLHSLLTFAALITINLGLFNLLPFPALDGGRVFFVFVELIIRRKIPADKEGIVHFIGFALLILLMLFATWNDITRLIMK